MPAPNSRTVRVFLSSTFRDFAEERDLLVRKIFPELRRRCRERQVELVDVDLRWGITEEEAQQGKVLPICLAEIDRSRPYFMGFLGERYGWVPEAGQYDLSLLLEQPWLEEHRGGKSVTELEILHGVLDNPAMEKRAFFYFRDPAWSEAQGGAYLAEGPAEQARLAELKDRIRQSGFPFVENYANPEELAERVREDLWQLIDEAYPESEVPDALTRERMTHEAYGSSRLGLYLGGEPYFAALDAAVTAAPRRPILVTGESGGGKSALLANWASRFARQNPNAILLTHYLAVGADAAQAVTLVIRILREISRFTGEELTLEGDPRKALHLLGPWLAKAGTFALDQGGAFVLVIDGLDKMDAPTDLGWWPAELPDGVALVASCLPGGVRDAVTQRMHWETISVSPLGRAECARFIKEHLEKYRKTLLPVFTERILDHSLSGNPLFLRTLLEELRVFGVHEELEARIDYYLASHTIDDLFERVLERVESDNSAESVRAFLEILWAAKESFAEDELLAVSGLPPAAWAPIHIALDESLIGHGGRVAFSHDYLRKAVQDRYLPTRESQQRIRERLASFCAESMREGRRNLSPYIRRHAVAHLLEAGDWDGASAALADLEFIEARAKAQELPAMLVDYARAERLLPEAREKAAVKGARRKVGADYGKAMVEYAATWTRIRGGSGEPEPNLPKPPPLVRPWTSEEIRRERERLTRSPNRAERTDAFRKFVATHLAPLSKHAARDGFVANLAHNAAPGGPVHEEGARLLECGSQVKLVRRFRPEEIYNPMEACVGILEGHTDWVCGLSLTSDGRLALSVSAGFDNSVRVWDVESGECLRVLEGHSGFGNCLSLTPNGRLVELGSEDGSLWVWDLGSSEGPRAIEGHTCEVTDISITPDGRISVSGSKDETVRVWDLESGECLRVLEGHSHRVEGIAITPDGRLAVSGSCDNTLRVWNLESGECLRVLEGHSRPVEALALTPDGRLAVSGDSDRTVRLWDLESGECLRVLLGHSHRVEGIAITPDGRLAVSGSWDKTLRVWNLESGENVNLLQQETQLNATLLRKFSKRLAISGVGDSRLRVWDVESGECIHLLEGHSGAVNIVFLAPDRHLAVSSSSDKTLRVWNLESGECVRVLEDYSEDVKFVALDDNGQIAVSAGWDADSLHQRLLVESSSTWEGIVDMVESTLRVWDLKSGECVHIVNGYKGMVRSLSLTPDGRLAALGSTDGTLRIWNLKSGECQRSIEGRGGPISLTANGRLAVMGRSDSTIRLCDLESGQCVRILEGHTSAVRGISVSPDGRLVVSTSFDDTLRVWDLGSGDCLHKLEVNVDYCRETDLSFSPDGRFFVSGSGDNTLRIWGLVSGEIVAVFYLRGLTYFEIDWSLRRLFTSQFDGRVEFYDIENLSLGPFITTAQREFASEDLPAGPVTARPVCCGQVIAIPPDLAECIEHWHLAGHDRDDRAYIDPALLLDCPSCGTPLRMNPFFVDLRPWSVD